MAKPQLDREPLIVEVAGEEIDLNPFIPLKIRTWRELKAKGVDPVVLGRQSVNDQLDITPFLEIATTVVRLARPSLTQEVIEDALTFGDVTRITKVVLSAEGGNAPVDRPTSIGSTPSPSAGAGAQPMSSA